MKKRNYKGAICGLCMSVGVVATALMTTGCNKANTSSKDETTVATEAGTTAQEETSEAGTTAQEETSEEVTTVKATEEDTKEQPTTVSQTEAPTEPITTVEATTTESKIKLAVPEYMEVFIGDLLDLYCQVTAPEDITYSYTWYESTTGKMEDLIAINRGSENNDTLHIDTDEELDSYFACMVEANTGEMVYSSLIHVTVEPFFTVSEDMVIPVGQNVELECITKGWDQYSFIWYETTTGQMQDIIAINRGAEVSDTYRIDTSKAGTRYYVVGVSKNGNEEIYYSRVIKVEVK